MKNTASLDLTFLVDNSAGPGCGAEHGLSIVVETDDTCLLFDSGQSSLFKSNAQSLGIDLNRIELAVLSHGHYDHGNGFEYFAGRRLICHPEIFIRRYREKNGTYIGLSYDRQQAEAWFDLQLSARPAKLSDSVTFLGQIPRLNDFEAKQTLFYDEAGQPDFVPDDSAIVAETAKGLVVIAGCSHSGICNIVDYAFTVTGRNDIAAVIGGFHLKEGSPAIEPTMSYLKSRNIKLLMPCHCVDASVIQLIHAEMPCEPVFSGRKVVFTS